MSIHEKVLRSAGMGWAISTPPAIGFWLVGLHVLAVLSTVTASLLLGLVLIWYLGWSIDSLDSGTYRADYLGAGNGIYMCSPYLVWGRKFRRRIWLRRVRALECDLGLGESAFTRE